MLYEARIKKLQESLPSLGCDALIIEDPTNLYYLTGMSLSTGSLIVYGKGALLFVDGRYLEVCKKHSPVPVLLTENPPFKTQLTLSPLNEIKKLGFDTEKTTYKNYLQLKGWIEKGSSIKMIPLDAPVQPLRAVKDEEEIKLLKNAGTLGSEGFDFVCTLLKEGISEIEIATELEIFWKRKGGKAMAFDPIIAFGPNSSMPHYRCGPTPLKSGDVVLIDIGVNLNNYHSDMTRMAYFGTPDPRIEAIHAIVQQAQRAALDICVPGTTLGALDAAARDLIEAAGYGQYFTHSLGHGVGLDIHEYPTIRKSKPAGSNPLSQVPLVPGMVITIEPGIYLPGIGGVRIEDTVVITQKGYDNFTNRPTAPFIKCR